MKKKHSYTIRNARLRSFVPAVNLCACAVGARRALQTIRRVSLSLGAEEKKKLAFELCHSRRGGADSESFSELLV